MILAQNFDTVLAVTAEFARDPAFAKVCQDAYAHIFRHQEFISLRTGGLGTGLAMGGYI